MEGYIEKPELTQVIEGFTFSSEESKSLMILICAFVMIDGDFSDDEERYLKDFCKKNNISYTDFIDNHENIFLDGDWEKVCVDKIVQLGKLSLDKKEIILAILYDLSVSDNFLHLNEKILQDISTFWGINVVFGKGHLKWTEEQKKLLISQKIKSYCQCSPGSGKTAVACVRISNLIDSGVEPSQIWLISFTRTVTQEPRDRISLFSDKDQNILGIKIATIDQELGI